MGRRRQSDDQASVIEMREEIRELRAEIQQLKERPHQAQITRINQEIEALYKSLESTERTLHLIKEHLMKQSPQNVQRRPEMRVPTFDTDKRDRPKKYIKELKKYIELSDTQVDLFLIANEGLKTGANDWWYAVQDSIETFQQFEAKFLNRFWSTELQKKLKSQLAMGRFNREGKITRVEYAIRMSNHARDLNMLESDAVVAIGEHFDKERANAIWGWKINKLDDLIEFLERVDSRKTFMPSKIEQEPNEDVPRKPKPWQVHREDKKIQSIQVEPSGSEQGN